MANNRIQWYYDTLTPGLAKGGAKLATKLAVFTDYQAVKVQDYMRANAPWTDRTGNARIGLFARPSHSDGTYSITCYHTVPYGIFLELKNDGQYAIIAPTLLHEGPRIMKSLSGLLSRLGVSGVA